MTLEGELQVAKDKLEEVVDKMTNEKDAFEAEMSSLKSSLKQSEEVVQGLQLEVKHMSRELEVSKDGQSEKGKEFQEKTQSLLSQLSDLELELAQQKQLCNEQQASCDDLSNKLKSKEEECASFDEITEKLKIELNENPAK